jgi:hypothetical protein
LGYPAFAISRFKMVRRLLRKLPIRRKFFRRKQGGKVMQKTKWILAFMVIASLIASQSYAQGECIVCHGDPPEIIQDCLASGCHDTYDNGNHHTTGLSLAGVCTACHDPNLVAQYDEENPLSYPATMATPTVESCANCHKGYEYGDPYPIYETVILEHMDSQGHVLNCMLCHGDSYDPGDPYLIRYCETCHSPETLHGITGHVEGSFWYDESGVWREITQEERCGGCHLGDPTMLYVPQDNGTYDTIHSELVEADCRGCHGVSVAERHHALVTCSNPPAAPVIDTNGCGGMSPIVGARMAHVTLTGTDFGDEQAPWCGKYRVQMKEGDTWKNLPVTTWGDNLIECSLPPDLFSPYARHRIRVKTPTGKSNKRKFYVLPAPSVDHIKDNTGGDTQGPAGGWLRVYSTLDQSQPFGKQGTFGGVRKKWYQDTLGGTCPKFFGSIYVVTLTSSEGQYCARRYKKWNLSGNKNFFKVKLQNIWRDDDGDYYKDIDEPVYGPNGDYPDIIPGPYSVQVCLIIYADTDGNDLFSGNEDTIYQVVKSQSGIVYEITPIQ